MLVGTGIGVGFGFLAHHYYSVNDAESVRLYYHHPHIASFLHGCYILPDPIEDKVS